MCFLAAIRGLLFIPDLVVLDDLTLKVFLLCMNLDIIDCLGVTPKFEDIGDVVPPDLLKLSLLILESG